MFLTVVDDDAAGMIERPHARYLIRPLGDGLHAIHRIENARVPGCGLAASASGVEAFAAMRDRRRTTVDASKEDIPNVDVLVFYNESAETSSGNIIAEIQAAFDDANQIYENSGIDLQVTLRHVEKIDYQEAFSVETDWLRLRATDDGFIDQVHDIRNDVGADLVALIVGNSVEYCGYADLPVTVSPANDPYAFSATTAYCLLESHIFTHELGHKLTAAHDWYVNPFLNAVYPYNHGFVNVFGRWHTVMAYPTECINAGVECASIPYFSNPNLSYDGTPLGVAEDQEFPADNTKMLNTSAPTIANYRASVPTTTTMPTTTTTIPTTTTSTTDDGDAADDDGGGDPFEPDDDDDDGNRGLTGTPGENSGGCGC
ncbi:MAG: M12 family metallo-peptidase [Deltaproteobacteria bacterium]|nr:M12 family metallo-peptidase [Deltaproteobacteria bacterium]